MSIETQEVANKRAIQHTVNSIFNLVFENSEAIDLRIEFSTKREYFGVFHFEGNRTKELHLIVLLDSESALAELLEVEDTLIDRIAELKEQKGKAA
ncbi:MULTISPECIES: hypothetical protein [Vibrio]|uniref:hypothetical protein n=1 Tax=Vibrio TaxID=662 RepID=UPI0007EEABC6|nr:MULTISPECIES: hypothetical protein [Vibrio]OBT07569.1 hypothetical protein A9265_14255 [Vibrio cyclitrophicus]PMM07016.1 hypothetical protein BCT63_05330 [Vibrio kanaloae]RPF57290.1 hypothetical protein EDB61_105192 [Vibrio crassostreae]